MSGYTYLIDQDPFLLKCDSSGSPIWNRTWGGVGSQTAIDLVLDSSNNIYLSFDTDMPGNPKMGLVK